MYNFTFRPFEILKLIRDGHLTKFDDLHHLPDSIFHMKLDEFIAGVEKVGLIKFNDDREFTPTPLLSELLKALRISLTQLGPYHEASMVCSPAFGSASEPPFDIDVFVLMPFSEELKPVYDDHIKSVAAGLNLKSARADDFFTADSIISDIWNAISAAQILVADCTGRNPNVFYELGVAHTLGKPVILISQTHDDIPFDVQHIRAIIYDFTPRGMQDFEGRLTKTLKTGMKYPHSSLLDLIAKIRKAYDR